MKPGLTSFAFPWSIGVPGYPAPAEPMTAIALVRAAASLNLPVIQLCDNLGIAEQSDDSLRSLSEEAAALGMCLELGGRGFTEQNLRRHIEMAKLMRVKLVRFVIDAPAYEPDLAEVAALIRANLDLLKAADVTLAIENHDRFRASELAAFIEQIADARVGICLDTANSLGAGEGFDTVFAALGPYTVSLHLKDVVVRRLPHGLGFTVSGCAPGDGLIGPVLRATLDGLKRFGRCNACLIEAWPEPSGDLTETIARERAWLKQGAALLTHLL